MSGVLLLPLNIIFAQTTVVPVDPSRDQFNPPNTPPPAPDQELISTFNSQIAEKQKQIEDLKLEEAQFQLQIDQTQTEINSIKSEVSSIDNQIALADLDIRTSQAQIDSLELEIRSLQVSIEQKNADIEAKRALLASSIRELDATSRTTTLALVMQTGSFSDFYSQAQAQAEISSSLKLTIGEIQSAKQELQGKQTELGKTKDDAVQSKLQLEVQRKSIEIQREYKDRLLDESRSSQGQYKQLLDQKMNEEASVNDSISSLRGRLQVILSGDAINQANLPSPQGYVWPVSYSDTNAKVITCVFHCPGYYWGVHSGLDLGVYPWTKVYAVADGTIMRCGQWSYGSDDSYPTDGVCVQPSDKRLSLIGIQHGGGILSEYMHLIQYAPGLHIGDPVFAGQFIGYSGGAVGAIGSGTQTQGGGHLHLEIRVDANLALHDVGTAVNPQIYLP